jgi:putative DNA replication protein dnaD
MDSELIEFLLDYCASIQKTSPRYIERVALDWSEQGITTVKQAQELIKDFELTKGMKRQKAGQGKQGTDAEKKTNRFLNFTQGEVDYDSLAKQKALKILQQGGNKEWH